MQANIIRAAYFSRDCDHKQPELEESHVTQHRNKHSSRGFLDQWLAKKRAPLMSLLEQRLFSFALVVLVDWGVLSILPLRSCDPTFKQQAVMPISAKWVDEVRSWLIDNGFAADTFEYASKSTVR